MEDATTQQRFVKGNMDISTFPQREEMKKIAKEASKLAYSPYSTFKVGSAILMENSKGKQKIFPGCNIENASYGLTNCGERTAIFSGIAQGYKKILAVCVYTPTETASPSCGACRQVINEFGPHVPVLYYCDKEEKITSLDALLPGAFGPENLL